MRVLWICNLMPPMFAEAAKMKPSNREGWVTGALETLVRHCREDGIQLGVAFPVANEDNAHGKVKGIEYFGFLENTAHPEDYDTALVAAIGLICEEFHPDVIHVFGTEYPHTLAMIRVSEWKKRAVVHLQGLMQHCADEYYAGLPDDVIEEATLRDVIRKDSLSRQKEKYEMRAVNEEQALMLADNACGRTDFDKAFFASVHPDATYYSLNESLRSCFYEGVWDPDQCEIHSICVAQGNLPLKGVHVMIEALALLKDKYPDVKLYIAGENLVNDGPVGALLRSSYGEYLRALVKKDELEDRVRFMGQLKDTEIKQLYLSSGLFVMPSFIENSPNSLGEAMLLGMPCVASEVGGIPSMASEEEVSFVKPGDVQALAAAVEELFEDREKALRLAAAARKRAILTYDREANYKMLKWMYESIIKDNS
ncbi:MAG: glycosyltransferase family 4 protein [Lachnospiraceae bacterium]|nr:glycosyltransferase family 4 protein [Lachnospiraceae bacterium]